jgi:hypothetical protein
MYFEIKGHKKFSLCKVSQGGDWCSYKLIAFADDTILQNIEFPNFFISRVKNRSKEFTKVDIDRVFDELHFGIIRFR